MSRRNILVRCLKNSLAEEEAVAAEAGKQSKRLQYGLTQQDTLGVCTLLSDTRERLFKALGMYSSCLFYTSENQKSNGGKRAMRDRYIYIGAAGIDIALLKLRENQKWLPECVASASATTPWCCHPDGLETSPSSSNLSVQCGAAGAWWVLAMRSVSPAASDSDAVDARMRIETFLKFCNFAKRYTSVNEWLYGRAGLLIALVLLKRAAPEGAVSDSAVNEMADAIYSSGLQAEHAAGCTQSLAKKAPLYYVWRSEEYIGAAHGYLGIIYAILQAPALQKNPQHPYHDKIKDTLDWLIQQRASNGNYPAVAGETSAYLVHFCHGAPGAVFLFSEAWRVYHQEKYKREAQVAAECVWRYGILRKGPGLCHGIAGNAYALSRWYQVSGDSIWLDRAAYFSLKLMEGEVIKAKADNPDSLFEGWAGVTYFLTDFLRDPNSCKMPLFQV